MTKTAIAYSNVDDASAAGRDLGAQLLESLPGVADALLLFASPRYDCSVLLEELNAMCSPSVLVGCTSAGEFTSAEHGESAACAVAIQSDDLHFAAGTGCGLRTNREAAASELVASFAGLTDKRYRYKTALILTDALAGHTDDLIHELTQKTAGAYQFFGGGAGDDAKFSKTSVFHGTRVLDDAVVALEILSNKSVGIGARHGWQPSSAPMRVTEAQGFKLSSLDAAPAVEAFEEHAKSTSQAFDEKEPVSFFIHNVVGIQDGDRYRLRVPLEVDSDGAVICAADIPDGSTTAIMGTTARSAAEAAAAATADAIRQLNGLEPGFALFFDCVATRLRTGRDFALELASVQEQLGSAAFAGFNTYGQIVRAEGQFGGFHNCTAVVCVIPR